MNVTIRRPFPFRPEAPTEQDSGAPPVLPDPLLDAARGYLGVDYLFPYQRLVVSNILEEKNQIVILPTGAGKTLCFQLPPLISRSTTLVVFPLVSLLADQLRRVEQLGIPAAVVRGGQNGNERRRIWNRVRAGDTRLLFATPEALLSDYSLRALADAGIAHLAADEAHCISEWGDTFRPAYLRIPEILAAGKIPQLTAFTATASPLILERVRSILFPGDPPHLVRGNPDRENITYRVVPTIAKAHDLTVLAMQMARPLVVFTRSRDGAELAARLLRERTGRDEVRFYHAGLEREEKRAVELWFFGSRDGVLATTCAYGMGVDKPDIRTVIHLDVPPSVESYLQESGRAGRDRLPAEAVLLVADEDRRRAAALAEGIDRDRYRAMIAYADCTGCRRLFLLNLLGSPEHGGCTGCDLCDGTDVKLPSGEEAIRRLVRRNRHRFSPSETVSILAGDRSPAARRAYLDSVRGYGNLREWAPDDVEDAVAALRLSRSIILRRRGPFAGRLTVPRVTGRQRKKPGSAGLLGHLGSSRTPSS